MKWDGNNKRSLFQTVKSIQRIKDPPRGRPCEGSSVFCAFPSGCGGTIALFFPRLPLRLRFYAVHHVIDRRCRIVIDLACGFSDLD